MAVVRRMDPSHRRRQLLAAALDVIRRDGTDVLTLAKVAEEAGVTKPIAYRHFKDRAGLLKALYIDYDERQHAAMREAVKAGGADLPAVTRIVADAYLECVMAAGPEMAAVTAALSATEEMEAFRDELQAEYLRQFHAAFAGFAAPASDAQFVAVLGACEALAQAVVAGRLNRIAATDALTAVIQGALGAA